MDKSRSLFPVSITFTSGEIPTPEKLSAIGTQARRGLNIVEYILGDTWNQGGDSFLQAPGATTYALMIPNIARFLGKSNNMNPRVPYATTAITSYNHLVSASDTGNRELTLSLPPTALTSFTWAGTSAPSGSPQTDIGNVNASNKWYIDRDTGWCYFYDAIQSDWNVTYAPQVEGDLGSDATWNVIPDINQEASYSFGSCKIAYKNGVDNSAGYMIYLPPRGPLDSSRLIDRSPQSQYDISGNTQNETLLPDDLPIKFWQRSSVEATTGSYAGHYRYSLPKVITDNYSNGATLPGGMIYLWDHSQTGTIIEGLIFTAEDVASPRSYVLIASGTALNSWVDNYFATAYPSANLAHVGNDSAYHTSDYYPSSGLKVITIGSDITSVLSNLIGSFYNHDHGSANSLPGSLVKHTKLSEVFSPIVSQASLSLRLPTSSWGYDDHPQYIHRLGYNASHLAHRDNQRGGMLGDFLLCSTSSSSNYLNLTADSFRVRFGSPASGGAGTEPYISYILNDTSADSMNSVHLNYERMTIGSPDGAAIEFREPNATWAQSEAIRLYHTSGSEPVLSIERADKTEGWGEGAAVEIGRIYSGSHNDATYGYNGYSYGPIRYYRIPATRWYLYEVFNTPDASSMYIPPSANWSGGNASHLLGYDYQSLRGFETFTTLIPSDGAFSNVALYIIDLPFKQYGVVGFRMSVKSNASTITNDSWYVRYGAYKHDRTAGGNGFQLLNFGEVNLYNIWGSTPGGLSTTGTTWESIFADTTGDPDLRLTATTASSSSESFVNNQQIYIMITVRAGASRLEIAGSELVYRIKEF